jgi:hypothetical protein
LGKAEANAETKAHHVGISPQEDRGGTKVAMVEGEGGAEESGIETWACCEAAAGAFIPIILLRC